VWPDLTTSRLILRRLLESDREALFAYRSDPEVSRFQGWVPVTLADADAFIRERPEEPDQPGTWFQLAITLKTSGLMIGDAGMHFPADQPQQAEIGLTLTPEYQRRGYATEALRAVLDFLFLTMNKHRVYGLVSPENGASVALLERCGLRREAHFRQSLWFKGEWVDDLIYAMLREEWINNNRSLT
jgi:RimJ/RimL family protein N-acetyltransferase